MGDDGERSLAKQRGRADWTGAIIGVLLIPVFFFFVFLGKAELGFTACIVLGMVLLAIKLRWKLRRHAWFWVTIAFVLVLHIPFFSIIHWPHHSSIPTRALALPLGIADFLLISGAISLAEKLFSKGDFSAEEDV